jgi:hypothetical protein
LTRRFGSRAIRETRDSESLSTLWTSACPIKNGLIIPRRTFGSRPKRKARDVWGLSHCSEQGRFICSGRPADSAGETNSVAAVRSPPAPPPSACSSRTGIPTHRARHPSAGRYDGAA